MVFIVYCIHHTLYLHW